MEKERKIKLTAVILLSLYTLLSLVRLIYFRTTFYLDYIVVLCYAAIVISLIKEFKYKNYILISASIILALIELHMFAINISYAFDFHYIYGLKLFFYLFEACVWILIAIFLLINNCPRFEQFKSKLSLIEKLAHFSLFLLATAFAVPSMCDLFTASYSAGGFDNFLLDFLWYFAIYTVKLSIISAQQKEKKQEGSILFKKENTASNNAEIVDEHFVSLGKHICLLLFTFGIWFLIWIYKATRFSNFVKDEQERKPSTALLLYIFIPFYSFYWTYKTAQRIDKIAKERNVQSDIATMCLVLAIFVPILPPIFMQDKINQAITGATVDNTSTKDNDISNNNNISDIEALEKYKELFDKGIITQEEFDAKKKQLLGL